MSREADRTAFLAKLIPYGMSLMNRAEAHGIEWRNVPIGKLEAEIVFAEEFSMPDEYRGSHNIQKRAG